MQQLLLIFLILATTHDYGRGQVIARLVKAEGRVYFKRLGMDTFSEKAEPGSAIKNGDEIKIGLRSFACNIDRTSENQSDLPVSQFCSAALAVRVELAL